MRLVTAPWIRLGFRRGLHFGRVVHGENMLVPLEIIESVLVGTEHFAPNADYYPEERLYLAIIIQAICDYESNLQRIQAAWLKNGEPVERNHADNLRVIRYECQGNGFQNFCLLADVPISKIFRKFQTLDKQYGLINVKFTDHDRIITDHEYRMRRRRTYHV